MKTRTTVSILTIAALTLAASSAFAQERQQQQHGARPQDRAQVERGQKDFDRDRMRQRDRISEPSQDRDRDQDRTHAPDEAGNGNQEIYGSELMSVEERNQYREQLRLAESNPEAKAKLMEQHREQMQIRAKEQGVKIDEPD
jgi:hypothetical protein